MIHNIYGMAERLFVLCEPLCFLVNRFGKTQAKLLKTVIFDFYKPEDITRAKIQLLNDAIQLMTTDSLPHIPKRRDGDTRITLEIDDMFAILNCLDEKNKLNCLPRYVAESPDNMPSARFFDGDMKLLQIWLEKIEGKIDHFGSSMDAIVAQIRTLDQQQRRPSNGPEVRSTTASQPIHVQPSACNVTQLSNTRTATKENKQNVNKQSSWAARVSTPNLRYSTTTTDNDNDSLGDFTEVNSRRKKRKLTKSNLNQPSQDPSSVGAQAASSVRSAPLIIGKKSVSSSPSNATNKLIAAKPFMEKSVFCIDNLHSSVTIEDVLEFVTNGLKINVVSCFETQPRKRRSDTLIADHKAFRLCINRDDRDHLLDASKWPVYVSVSDWFFKSRQPSTLPHPQPSQQEQQQQQDVNSQHDDSLATIETQQLAAIEQAIDDGMFDDNIDDVLEVTIQSVNTETDKRNL
jgi:hypothetical protein